MFKDTSKVIIACITAVLITVVLVFAFMNRNRANDVISVTGLVERDFVADLIVWNGSFTTKDVELKAAFQQLKQHRAMIREFLDQKKIPPKQILFSSVEIAKEFKSTYSKERGQTREFTGYRLTQRIDIESRDIDKIEALSREITELINSGIEINSSAPSYYYTKLGKLKIEMLALATANARVRAQKIAQNSGGELGKLKYAKLGVFQIIAQNSSEQYTWSGAYNTSAKNKTGAVTVKLQYELQ